MKIKWCILILLIPIILTSCSTFSGFIGGGFGNFFGSSSDGTVGGRGVMLKFVDAPDNNAEFSEGIPFTITIQVENNVVNEQGLNGRLCLKDGLSDSFGGILDSDQCVPVSLPTASKVTNKINPSIDRYDFGPYSYRGLQKELSLKTMITADFSYEIDSIAGASACVKRKAAQSSTIPSNCGEKQNLQVQQPDLPVKITSISSRVASKSDSESILLLDITLSNSHGGQVLSSGSALGATNNLPTTAEIDFDITINQQPAICEGVSRKRVEIRKNENQKVIKCRTDLLLNQDYLEAPIVIKMNYGYKQSIPGPTLILKKEDLIA
ncbi:hypothetical protein J4216_06560 [Candidatus Woesearchaeota archaeon]|nr:hypothetical protein [Candidatus Woesearchaeota archaeon]